MATIADTFHTAASHYLANRMAEAEQICRQLLTVNPAHTESLHLLGNIALRRGDAQHAVGLIKKAVTQDSRNAAYHLSLGQAYRTLGRLDDARACFKTAIKLQPKSYQGHFNSGALELDARRFAESVASFKRAIAINPKLAEAHNGLGLAFQGLGLLQEALASFQKAKFLKPDFAEAHFNMGMAHQHLGDIDDALEAYKRALELQPHYAAAYNNLGSLCYNRHRLEETLEYCRHALRLEPNLVEAHINLGLALRMLGRFKEATASLQCAVALRPTLPNPYVGLAMIAEMEGRFEAALDYYRRALDLHPEHPGALWNQSLCLLRHGELAKGWEGFEWRWQNPITFNSPRRPFSQPKWKGEDLGEGALLIWGEQGVGDEVLCGSMIPDLISRDIDFILECDRRLVPLFRRSWPEANIVSRADPPAPQITEAAVVRQTPMASLGAWLRPSFDAFPKRAGFLTPDWPRQQEFRAKVANDANSVRGKTLIIGISWVSKNLAVGNQKSSSLLDWAPILHQRNVRFVDLQYGNTESDRAEVKKQLGVDVTHLDNLDNFNDLDGLAALISACDLVITVSNTTAHLAGALGVPAWVLLPSGLGHTWYWFTEREDSPWYSSVRLFRQPAPNDWRPVIKQVAKALSKLPRR